MYTCTNDRYDNNPNNSYEDVSDFLAMCKACYGERPALTMIDGGDTYTDDDGEVVLRRVED